jgi:hypothetical protein
LDRHRGSPAPGTHRVHRPGGVGQRGAVPLQHGFRENVASDRKSNARDDIHRLLRRRFRGGWQRRRRGRGGGCGRGRCGLRTQGGNASGKKACQGGRSDFEEVPPAGPAFLAARARPGTITTVFPFSHHLLLLLPINCARIRAAEDGNSEG